MWLILHFKMSKSITYTFLKLFSYAKWFFFWFVIYFKIRALLITYYWGNNYCQSAVWCKRHARWLVEKSSQYTSLTNEWNKRVPKSKDQFIPCPLVKKKKNHRPEKTKCEKWHRPSSRWYWTAKRRPLLLRGGGNLRRLVFTTDTGTCIEVPAGLLFGKPDRRALPGAAAPKLGRIPSAAAAGGCASIICVILLLLLLWWTDEPRDRNICGATRSDGDPLPETRNQLYLYRTFSATYTHAHTRAHITLLFPGIRTTTVRAHLRCRGPTVGFKINSRIIYKNVEHISTIDLWIWIRLYVANSVDRVRRK